MAAFAASSSFWAVVFLFPNTMLRLVGLGFTAGAIDENAVWVAKPALRDGANALVAPIRNARERRAARKDLMMSAAGWSGECDLFSLVVTYSILEPVWYSYCNSSICTSSYSFYEQSVNPKSNRGKHWPGHLWRRRCRHHTEYAGPPPGGSSVRLNFSLLSRESGALVL